MTCRCFFQAPRVEAQTILGSLVCFPNIYHQIPVLQNVPGSHEIIVSNEDIKVRLTSTLHVVTYTHILMLLVPFFFFINIVFIILVKYYGFIFIEFISVFLCQSCCRQSSRQIYSGKGDTESRWLERDKTCKGPPVAKGLLIYY